MAKTTTRTTYIVVGGQEYSQKRNAKGQFIKGGRAPLEAVKSGIYNERRTKRHNLWKNIDRINYTQNKSKDGLKEAYAMLRFANFQSLKNVGGLMTGSSGLALAVAGRSIQVGRDVANFGLDIYLANTGETMIASNIRTGIDIALNPIGEMIGRTISAGISQLSLNRSNQELEYHRRLTGNIVDTRDKGRY